MTDFHDEAMNILADARQQLRDGQAEVAVLLLQKAIRTLQPTLRKTEEWWANAYPLPAGVTLNGGKKFDIQLNHGIIEERQLAKAFCHADFHLPEVRFELKSESWLWERTNNMAVEMEADGLPSGICATESHFWVENLMRDGQTLVYLVFPMDRLRWLVKNRGMDKRGGDGGRFLMRCLSLHRDIYS